MTFSAVTPQAVKYKEESKCKVKDNCGVKNMEWTCNVLKFIKLYDNKNKFCSLCFPGERELLRVAQLIGANVRAPTPRSRTPCPCCAGCPCSS